MFGEQSLLMIVIGWSALAVACAWLAPGRWQPALIALCGIALLACVSPLAAVLLGAGTTVTYVLHARGPVGLVDLTTYKNVVRGKGTTRP